MKPVRLAIVGAGVWSRRLLPSLLARPDLALTSVWDADPRAMAEFPWQIARAKDLAHAFVHGDPEAVLCAVTPGAQTEIALGAMRSGLHVFAEKPLALSSLSAHELTSEALKLRRHLQVGHVVRFSALHQRLRQSYERQLFGELRRIDIVRTATRRRPGFRPLWVNGTHDIRLLCDWFEEPLRVAFAREESAGEVARLYTQSGVEVNLRFGYAEAAERSWRCSGTRGEVFLDEVKAEWSGAFERSTEDEALTPPEDDLGRQWNHFLSQVRRGDPEPLELGQELRTVMLLEQISAALSLPRDQSGRFVLSSVTRQR